MNRLFPIADSVLLAVTVWAAGTSATRFYEGGSAAYWSAFVVGVIAFAGAYIFGGRRGRRNVDGVFLGPRARICAMLFLAAGIGSYILQRPPESGDKPEPPDVAGRETAVDCSAATKNLLDKLEAAAEAGHQNCGDLVILRRAAAPLKTRCSDEGSTKATKAYQDTTKRYEEICRDPTQVLAATIVQPPDQDKRIRIIKEDPSGVEIEVPAIPDAVFGQEPPAVEDSPSGVDVRESPGPAAPGGRRERLSYKTGMREGLLRILLAILRLQFPLLAAFSEKELLQGILNSNPENGGQPLRRLFDEKNLSPAARSQLTAYLLRTAELTARADPNFAKGVRAFAAGDLAPLAMQICFGLISQVTGNETFRLSNSVQKHLMDAWRKQSKFERDGITDDVEGCIRDNTKGENTRAILEEFKKDRGVAIGS